MGTRGRAPTPTPLKLLAAVQKSRINTDEPAPGDGPPDCPSKNKDVLEVWDYTVRHMDAMGIITTVDRDVLHAYCVAVVAFREAVDIVEKEGSIITSSHGGLVRHPACQAVKENAMLMKGFAQQFGLTPSARTTIRVGDSKLKPKEQGAARLLTG